MENQNLPIHFPSDQKYTRLIVTQSKLDKFNIVGLEFEWSVAFEKGKFFLSN